MPANSIDYRQLSARNRRAYELALPERLRSPAPAQAVKVAPAPVPAPALPTPNRTLAGPARVLAFLTVCCEDGIPLPPQEATAAHLGLLPCTFNAALCALARQGKIRRGSINRGCYPAQWWVEIAGARAQSG